MCDMIEVNLWRHSKIICSVNYCFIFHCKCVNFIDLQFCQGCDEHTAMVWLIYFQWPDSASVLDEISFSPLKTCQNVKKPWSFYLQLQVGLIEILIRKMAWNPFRNIVTFHQKRKGKWCEMGFPECADVKQNTFSCPKQLWACHAAEVLPQNTREQNERTAWRSWSAFYTCIQESAWNSHLLQLATLQ